MLTVLVLAFNDASGHVSDFLMKMIQRNSGPIGYLHLIQ